MRAIGAPKRLPIVTGESNAARVFLVQSFANVREKMCSRNVYWTTKELFQNSPVLLDTGEEVEFLVWGEEAGFYGVGGEFAHLVEGEFAELLDEDVFVEEVRA